MACDLLRSGPRICASRAGRVNRIDKLELLSNVSALRREAKALLADSTGAAHAARLRRILIILGYMREHLEMVATPLEGDGADREKAASRAVGGPHPVSDLP